MPTNWDEPIVAGVTRVKAAHINELRTAVNGLRSLNNLAAYSWSGGGNIVAGAAIRAQHFTEIRDALQDVWTRKNMGQIYSWTSGQPPAPSRSVKATDVHDLRDWINQVEDSTNLEDPQGITTFWFDPNGTLTVTPNWCADLYGTNGL